MVHLSGKQKHFQGATINIYKEIKEQYQNNVLTKKKRNRGAQFLK